MQGKGGRTLKRIIRDFAESHRNVPIPSPSWYGCIISLTLLLIWGSPVLTVAWSLTLERGSLWNWCPSLLACYMLILWFHRQEEEAICWFGLAESSLYSKVVTPLFCWLLGVECCGGTWATRLVVLSKVGSRIVMVRDPMFLMETWIHDETYCEIHCAGKLWRQDGGRWTHSCTYHSLVVGQAMYKTFICSVTARILS